MVWYNCSTYSEKRFLLVPLNFIWSIRNENVLFFRNPLSNWNRASEKVLQHTLLWCEIWCGMVYHCVVWHSMVWYIYYGVVWYNESIINSIMRWFGFMHTPTNYHLFKVVENRMQQCCAAHIVHSCQQYCSALLSLNQPVIRCNNAEQYCW